MSAKALINCHQKALQVAKVSGSSVKRSKTRALAVRLSFRLCTQPPPQTPRNQIEIPHSGTSPATDALDEPEPTGTSFNLEDFGPADLILYYNSQANPRRYVPQQMVIALLFQSHTQQPLYSLNDSQHQFSPNVISKPEAVDFIEERRDDALLWIMVQEKYDVKYSIYAIFLQIPLGHHLKVLNATKTP
ncbi:hypothetical protein VKT23_005025 [Stygiomarasmius scandens]|uniref:Uncharacterized protein n=1 Tax=Marasmiellus scandens TaxID=2682957 RepID=A0ABR1JRX3_9AGAR